MHGSAMSSWILLLTRFVVGPPRALGGAAIEVAAGARGGPRTVSRHFVTFLCERIPRMRQVSGNTAVVGPLPEARSD